MLTTLLAALPLLAAFVLVLRTFRSARGPFATLGDTSLEDFFGERFARKIHLCLAAALAAFSALLAGGTLGQ